MTGADSCGVGIEGTAEVVISGGEIRDIERGISCGDESQVKLSSVKIASAGDGVQVEGVSNTEVTSSAVTSAKGVCVSYGTSASGLVEKSELKGVVGASTRTATAA